MPDGQPDLFRIGPPSDVDRTEAPSSHSSPAAGPATPPPGFTGPKDDVLKALAGGRMRGASV